MIRVETAMQRRPDICGRHGPFTSVLICGRIWVKCPKCSAEYHAEEERRRQESEAQARQLRWQQKLGQAGIPERFQDRTLESYQAETPGQIAALEFARQFAAQFDDGGRGGRSALFLGRPGTGKTHLAAAIGARLLRHQRTVLFTTAMRVARMVRDSWERGSGMTESAAVGVLAETDLLIIDEVGVQAGSEFEKNLLFDVLNDRYGRRLSTILISNLTTDQVREFLGGRIFDRLREDGGKAIRFDWDSHRGRL